MPSISELIAKAENPYAGIVEDGLISDISGYIDTGSYIFNALVSGSIYKGIPSNRIIALAGEQATGKCMRGNQKITIFVDEETKRVIQERLKSL